MIHEYPVDRVPYTSTDTTLGIDKNDSGWADETEKGSTPHGIYQSVRRKQNSK